MQAAGQPSRAVYSPAPLRTPPEPASDLALQGEHVRSLTVLALQEYPPPDAAYDPTHVQRPVKDALSADRLELCASLQSAAGDDPRRNACDPLPKTIDICVRIVAVSQVDHQERGQRRPQGLKALLNRLVRFDLHSFLQELGAEQGTSLPVFSHQHYLGHVPYNLLQVLAAQFDVGILPGCLEGLLHPSGVGLLILLLQAFEQPKE